MKPIDSLDRLLKYQLQAWRLKNAQMQTPSGPVITITRQPGCDDETIAQKLAQELGLVVYGHEIVEQIAHDTQVSEAIVATLDEKARSDLDDWLAEWEGERNLTEYRFLESLRKILFAIAAHGNAVILGRGGNFLLPAGKRIGLFLVAPLEARIKNIMAELHLSEKLALEHIAKLEKEHRVLAKKYFHADIHEATHYHLVINTALVKPETIVRIVKGIVG